MVRRSVSCAAFALALMVLAPATSQAQILNGGFDDPNPFANWQASSGTSAITNPAIAQSPSQSIFFANSSATLSQTFSAVAGQYFLSFYLRAFATAPVAMATINVLVNGQQFVGAASGSDYSRTLTAAVTLQSSGNTIQFLNASASAGAFAQLDSVSFQAVPTPLAGAGGLSFAMAGLFLGWKRLRRRQAA